MKQTYISFKEHRLCFQKMPESFVSTRFDKAPKSREERIKLAKKVFDDQFRNIEKNVEFIRKNPKKARDRIKKMLGDIEVTMATGELLLKVARQGEAAYKAVKHTMSKANRYLILLSLISQNNEPDLAALEKDDLLKDVDKVSLNDIDWYKLTEIPEAQRNSRFFQAQMIAMAVRNVAARKETVSKIKVTFEVLKNLSKRALIKDYPLFAGRHIRWFADTEKDPVITGESRFATKEQQAAIRSQKPASMEVRRAKNTSKAKAEAVKRTILDDVKTGPIGTFIFSDHGVVYKSGGLAGFSINSDAPEDKQVIIKVEELVEALKVRLKSRRAIPDTRLNIKKDVDYFLFSNCKGYDLQKAVVEKLPANKRNQLLFVTGSEFGQLGWDEAQIRKRGGRVISKKRVDPLLQQALKIEGGKPSTFGTLYANEESDDMNSNPSVIHSTEKGEPEQISAIEKPKDTLNA